MKPKRVAFLGLCVALSMILSYFEGLVPPLVAIPGIKIGFANLVAVFMLYRVSSKETVAVSMIRVILVNVLFGTAMTLIFSLAGAACSLVGMILLKKSERFTPVAVSVVGGVLHNIGQILTAMILLETSQIIFYLPVLLISGTVAGVIIGIIAAVIAKRLEFIKL